jgi:hypothetical protein
MEHLHAESSKGLNILLVTALSISTLFPEYLSATIVINIWCAFSHT